MIKRSDKMLQFLATNDSLDEEDLELVWKCQEGKHEEAVRIVYEAITAVAGYLTVDQIQYLFSKIKQIPSKDYSELTINFIKDFTESAFRASNSMKFNTDDDLLMEDKKPAVNTDFLENIKETVEADSYEFEESAAFGLPMLWKLMQKNGPLAKIAFESIKEIFKYPHSEDFKSHYIILCLRNIYRDEACPQSIDLLNNILEETFIPQRNDTGAAMSEVVYSLQEKLDLIGNTINGIGNYLSFVKEELVQQAMRDEVNEDNSTHVF